MKVLWSRQTHFKIVWGSFLVLPPIMIAFAVLISLSLLLTGQMGADEWLFVSLYVAGSGAIWVLRLYLNRFGWLRRWMHLDQKDS